MKILISTGIYPPKIGGPAQYSKNLASELSLLGHSVKVSTFSLEDYLPSGIRHIYFFLKILPKVFESDYIIVLDTFSVGLPTVFASRMLNKKVVIRTGGDFLWENYVERTKEKVLFSKFYADKKVNFTLKEKVIFNLTKWTLNNSDKVIFSTDWQRNIFVEAYKIKALKATIIENFYGEKEANEIAQEKIFVASSRNLVWKNADILKSVFSEIQSEYPEVKLFLKNIEFSQFMHTIKSSYAVVLVSLGDISPNLILDAIRYNRPFVCTKEVGIFDRIKDTGIFVDPLDKEEIKRAITSLLDNHNYQLAKSKVESFSHVHTWKEIANEFLSIYNLL